MVVPQIQFHRVHLFGELCVVINLERRKHQLRGTLNNGLTFTQQRKYTIVTFIRPELFCSRNNRQIPAVSHKYRALTWRDVNLAIVSLIDVHVGSNIKNEVFGVFAVINVVLLAFY